MPRSPRATGPLPIFRSDAQARLLADLFLNEERPMSLSALSARIATPISTLSREVDRLVQAGILTSERVGTTRLVYTNRESPYFRDLASLIMKAFGPTTLLGPLFRRVPRVDAAFVYGSWARRYAGEEGPPPRDLDVVVIGTPQVNAVYAAGRRAESELGIEVNPLVVSPEEWANPKGIVRRIQSGPIVEIPLNGS